MTVDRESKIETRFARRTGVGKGVGIDDAVAAAEMRIDSMRTEAREGIGKMIAQMQERRQEVLDSQDEALCFVRGRADALVGLCGLFGHHDIEKAAISLCNLFDACQPDWPSIEGVCVHLDAIYMFWSSTPDLAADASPQVLDGLRQVAAAARRRSTPGASS